jgi:hypothetical protein
MSVDVSLDELILLGLDFQLNVPCEHGQHNRKHQADDPAAWVVMYLCHKCPERRQYLLCESGRVYMQPPTLLGCTGAGCGASGYWSDFFILCEPLERAA